MGNGALAANGHPNPGHGVNDQTSAIGITTHGSDWYWVCFSIYTLFHLYFALQR